MRPADQSPTLGPSPPTPEPMEGVDVNAQTEATLNTNQQAVRPSGGRGTYANALKRSIDQVESDDQDSSMEDAEEEVEGQDETKAEPGPIKGFSSERVLENLNPQVRQAWKDQADEAIFVHYLSGGYTPNVAQNVHVIAKDLTSEYQRATVEQRIWTYEDKQKYTPNVSVEKEPSNRR